MSLTDGTGLSAADVLALTNGNNNDGFGNFGGGWWVILFILLLGGGFGNWGRNGYGNGSGNDMSNMAVPYILGNQSGSEVQRGFDQQAVITALGNLSTAVANGFAAVSVDSCNKAMANMQAINGVQMQMSNDKFDTISTLNNGHNAILQQMGTYEMARQNCCCENKAAIADLKYTVATENCADRTALDSATAQILQAINSGFQNQTMQNMQAQLDAERRVNDQLRMENQLNAFNVSQNAQTQQLYANNQAQTDRIMDYLNPPYARPFYSNNGFGGCGCGNS